VSYWTAVEEENESAGYVIHHDIEDDAPVPQVAAGATADPVKDYLRQIGKVAPLNAELGGRAREAHRGRHARR
jgi:RNA polymerase primary sigma factor